MECYNTNKEKHVHEKRKRSGNIDEKKKKYINKRFTDFGMFVCMLTGCSGKSGKEEKVTEIEILQYKQEAAAYLKSGRKV